MDENNDIPKTPTKEQERIEFLENETHRLQKQLESLNLAMDDMEKLIVDRNTFFSNMSHEIRTPLNAIVGMADLLTDTELTTQQKECVEVIHKGSELLLMIINDVLNLSRIESGKISLEALEFNPRTMAESAFSIQAYQIWNKGVEAVINVAPETPYTVIGDPTYTTQIVTNFLSNAVKFTSQGSIQLIVSFETLLEDGRAMLRFAVKDSGIGIAPENVTKLFQAYRQAEASTTRKFGGTGLGLTISKRLASLMGGNISVESVPGEGSTFYVDIPFRVAHWQPPTPHWLSLKDKRILLVESQTASKNSAVNLIASLEGIATPVSTCDEAYEHIISGSPYDLLLLSTNCLHDNKDGQSSFMAQQLIQTFTEPILFMVPAGKSQRYLHLVNDSSRMGFLGKPLLLDQCSQEIGRVLGIAQGKKEISSQKEKSPDEIKANNAKITVLIVEDNSTNRLVITRLLQRLGITACETAADGLLALDAMSQKVYDLVLMDIQMPNLGGLEATQNRRKFEEETKAPRQTIVALTADAMPNDREKCLAAGMDDYLPKPIKTEFLIPILVKYCNYKPLEEVDKNDL